VTEPTDTTAPGDERWRVGHISDPLGFVPHDRLSWNHRFDDPGQRFRTLYCALRAETALREVLADFRRQTGELAEYAAVFGQEAIDLLPADPISADWRRQHILAPCRIESDGELLDLTDPDVTHELEHRHAQLLSDHGLPHLDLTDITVRRRPVTQAIAADAYNALGVAVIRFPSNLDGLPCYALFEGRATLVGAGEPTPLTDPPPRPLENVAAGWHMTLEPAPVAAATEVAPFDDAP
jgi:RES domain